MNVTFSDYNDANSVTVNCDRVILELKGDEVTISILSTGEICVRKMAGGQLVVLPMASNTILLRLETTA